MVIHKAQRDTQHNGAHDSPLCNHNLGIYHNQYVLADDDEKVTCKRCIKCLKSQSVICEVKTGVMKHGNV